MNLVCWNCGHSLDDIPRPISRHATCGKCFNELHCCRLCKHYDPSRTMQCFEDRADPPLQKENANFCDFFTPQPNAHEAQTTNKSDAAKDKLADLFADSDPGADKQDADDQGADEQEESADESPYEENTETPEEAARRKLDDLFN